MLKINKVSFKNFFSYGEPLTTVDFTHTSPRLIYGVNGAGKSTIFEAVIWGLFGETLKGVAADDVVNRANDANCCVTILGEINENNFVIRRYRKDKEKKNYIEFELNGAITVGETNKATQKIICKTLGVTYDSFLYTSYFNPSLSESFASLGDKKQKGIIEQLIASDIWDTCGENASEELKLLQGQQNKQVSDRAVLASNKVTVVNGVTELRDLLKQSNLKGLKSNIDKNTARIVVCRQAMSKRAGLEKKIREMETRKQEATHQYNLADKYLTLAMQGKCRHCVRAFELSKDERERLESKKKLMHEALTAAQSSHKSLSAELNTIWNLELEESKLCAELESFDAMFDLAQATKDKLDKAKKTVKALTNRLVAVNKSITGLDQKIGILESVKKLAGPRGARVYALNHLIPHLNRSLKMYSNELSEGTMGVSLTFDPKTARTSVQCEFDHVMDYASCSSGQARRVDLCIMLAFLELLKYLGKNTNFLILDEFLDSLDKKGVENTLQILYNLRYDNVFIISHNTELKDTFENKLLVKKTPRGFSYFAEPRGPR